MACVMGLDQHRAQIAAEWIDTMTGETARSRSRRQTGPLSGSSLSRLQTVVLRSR